MISHKKIFQHLLLCTIFLSEFTANANCVSGKFLSSTSTCLDCPTGYHTGGGQNPCIACGSGYYNDQVGSIDVTSCKACPKGSYGDHKAAVAAFDNLIVGSFTCLKCISGKWSNTEGVNDPAGCTNCVAGKYSFDAGATSSATCKNCAAGRWSSTVANNQVSGSPPQPCIGCAVGKFVSTEGSNAATFCVSCGAGKYNDEIGQKQCKNCIRGRFAAYTTKIFTFTTSPLFINEVAGTIVKQGSVANNNLNVGRLHITLTGANTVEIVVAANVSVLFDVSEDLILGTTTISSSDLNSLVTVFQGPGKRHVY
jgi:hypothetical protein